MDPPQLREGSLKPKRNKQRLSNRFLSLSSKSSENKAVIAAERTKSASKSVIKPASLDEVVLSRDPSFHGPEQMDTNRQKSLFLKEAAFMISPRNADNLDMASSDLPFPEWHLEGDEQRKARLNMVTASIKELVDTERDFIKDLDTMIEKIMKPMENKRDFITGERLVSPADMTAIWSNICLLPPVNKALLTALEDEKIINGTDDDRQGRIGSAFLRVSDYMKIYTTFCSNQPLSTATVISLCKDSQFEAFLAEKADVCVMEESRNLDLNAFLIKPVQRICKYPLFFRELLRYTPRDHPSFHVLTLAANKIDRVVLQINESKKKAENNLRLAEISAKFVKCDIPILVPGREIILLTEFKKVFVKKKWMKGTVILFSDIILLAKADKKGQLKYAYHGPVCHLCIIEDKAKDGSQMLTSQGRVAFSIIMETDEKMVMWRNAFVDLVTKAKQERKKARSTM